MSMAQLDDQTRVETCSAMTWLLVGDLREMLQDHLDPDALRWLTPVLDALIESLCEQCDLQRDDGLYGDVLEPFPQWYPAVERVRSEQKSLCRSLRMLRHRIDAQLPYTRLAAELESELAAWVQHLIENRRSERELMQRALYTEIGGEG